MKQGVRIVREQRFWPSGRFENINVCELGLVLSSACIWQVVQRPFSNFQLAVYIGYRNILLCVCVLRTLQGSSSPRIVVQKGLSAQSYQQLTRNMQHPPATN